MRICLQHLQTIKVLWFISRIKHKTCVKCGLYCCCIFYGVTLLPNYGNFMLESTSIFIWMLPTPFAFMLSHSLSHSLYNHYAICSASFIKSMWTSGTSLNNTEIKGNRKALRYEYVAIRSINFSIMIDGFHYCGKFGKNQKDATRVMMNFQMGKKTQK